MAGRIADRAMATGLAALRQGVRECDVAAAILAAQASGVAEAGGTEVPGIAMPSGRRTDSPHLSWTDEPYQSGTPVNIELGGSRNRYVCGLSRTVHVGRPPGRLASLHAATLAGMDAVFEAVRPGFTAAQVEEIFRSVTERHGVVKRSRIGYSIGIDWLEPWASLQPGDTTVLQPNMTFHLMLGMWQRDWGLVLSETFVVTETGIATFSSLPREPAIVD